MIDNYIYVITALLPLTASMVVFQANPYHALIIRGILGAVAALVYAVLGAADVALTEALVGTMLAVTLYVIAVRSSLVMRVGILKNEASQTEENESLTELIDSFKKVVSKYHLRLELVPYSNLEALEQGLSAKEIHATCIKSNSAEDELEKNRLSSTQLVYAVQQPYQTTIRVRRLYEIMQSELSSPEINLIYVSTANAEEKH
jgi:putative multicomponent Na+:H+ antiporter subunit B